MTIFTDYTYENTRRLVYGEGEGATFVPVCSKCGRFVKADETIRVNGEGRLVDDHNATCSKCGRTSMLFEGYV